MLLYQFFWYTNVCLRSTLLWLYVIICCCIETHQPAFHTCDKWKSLKLPLYIDIMQTYFYKAKFTFWKMSFSKRISVAHFLLALGTFSSSRQLHETDKYISWILCKCLRVFFLFLIEVLGVYNILLASGKNVRSK